LRAWLWDETKTLLLSFALATIVVELVYWTIRFAPQSWWLIAWVIFLALFVLMAQIAPVVLFPIFYKFSPLNNDELKNRLDRSERQILEQHRRRLETAAAAVRHYDVRRMLAGIHQELDSRLAALAAAARTLLLRQRGIFNQLTGQLEALSPLAILDRGYALVFDSAGMLLKDADRVKAGDEISARLAKGMLTATVGRRKQK